MLLVDWLSTIGAAPPAARQHTKTLSMLPRATNKKRRTAMVPSLPAAA